MKRRRKPFEQTAIETVKHHMRVTLTKICPLWVEKYCVDCASHNKLRCRIVQTGNARNRLQQVKQMIDMAWEKHGKKEKVNNKATKKPLFRRKHMTKEKQAEALVEMLNEEEWGCPLPHDVLCHQCIMGRERCAKIAEEGDMLTRSMMVTEAIKAPKDV